jgi:hypothetical protein
MNTATLADDLAADVEQETPATVLNTVAQWAERLRAQSVLVARLEAELTIEQGKLARLELEQVPEAMAEAGLTDLGLEDGSRLVVKSDIKVSVSVANRPAAYDWLRSTGNEMAVRQTLEVDMRPLTPKEKTQLVEALEARHAEAVMSETVHHSTLKSIVSHALEAGHKVPECVTVFQFKKATVKAPK